MQISAPAKDLLQLIFSLSSRNAALTRPALERRLGLDSSELGALLEQLAAGGLVDIQRLRLTLSGLAVAAACRAGQTRTRPRSAERRSVALAAPIALFSQRETPRAVA